MSSSAPYRAAQNQVHSGFFAEQDFSAFELSPADRIGQPVRRRRSRLWVPVFVGLAATGWFAVADRSEWVDWAIAQIAAMAPATETRPAKGPEHPPQSGQTALATKPEPLPETTREIAATTPERIEPAAATTEEPAPPVVATAATTPDAAIEKAQPEPLPPPTVDPADPYQKKAAGVGLHPELSRVLLERLSPVDFRNAGHAIRTALAETPDDGVYVWPLQRKPELALFQVNFVPGAAGNCRRYVVKVTKDGWLTTALPMERCGIKPKQHDALVRSREQSTRPPHQPVGK